MFTLAIETSCDETACAIVEDGWIVHANVIASSLDLHKKTGGVVPEIAARAHIESIIPVIEAALKTAFPEMNRTEQISRIDQIAVSSEPGLVTSLLVGLETAKTLAYLWKKPLVKVNHVRGHVYANWLERNPEEDPIHFPVICLSVSGGHNELILMKSHEEWEILGQTQDDAAGEAFDKVARILGLGYPGGPIIESKASKFQSPMTNDQRPATLNTPPTTLDHILPTSHYPLLTTTSPLPTPHYPPQTTFPRAWLNANNSNKRDGTSFDFSFSGLKSEVLREVQRRGDLTEADQIEIAYAFQKAVCDVLATKLIGAARKFKVAEIHLAGGVSANKRLRELVREKASLPFRYPVKMSYCTDNAAMIGAAAHTQPPAP